MKARIVGSVEPGNRAAVTEVLSRLPKQITEAGDIKKLKEQEEVPGVAQAPAGAPGQASGNGGGTGGGGTSGTGNGGNGEGGNDGGAPFRQATGGGGLGKTEVKEAFKEALEETGVAGSKALSADPFYAQRAGSTTVKNEIKSEYVKPADTVVQQADGGTLRIPHKPGEVITPGGVLLTRDTEDPNK
jgi:hypothetical protein